MFLVPFLVFIEEHRLPMYYGGRARAWRTAFRFPWKHSLPS